MGKASICFIVCLALVGCKTVHTDNEEAVPVAMWFDGPRHVDAADPQIAELVATVLRAKGLHPRLDGQGVFVPPSEEKRAREALLLSPRMKGSGVLVPLMVEAGTARRTVKGYDVPRIDTSDNDRPPAKR